MNLKDQKEAFVTGHSGTTVSEALLVCTFAPVGVFLYNEIKNYYNTYMNRRRNSSATNNTTTTSSSSSSFIFLIVIESLTILFPMTISQTQYLHPYGVRLLVTELILGLLLRINRRFDDGQGQGNDNEKRAISISEHTATTNFKQKDFLSFFRSTVSYNTFVAILAVDFTIFPRSFAKTEIYGYGLMDLGAGSFCVIGGLVSKFARSSSISTPNSTTGTSKTIHSIKKVILHSIPLLIMGFVRLITTKGLEYQEHVSEYGTHWNFFFTLLVVNIACTLIRSSTWKILNVPIITWLVILIAYQYLLSVEQLQNYIIHAPRACTYDGGEYTYFFMDKAPSLLCDLFAANREGILGCIGYIVLYLASEDVGRYCLWGWTNNDNNMNNASSRSNSCITLKQSKLHGKRLFGSTVCFWLMHWILSNNSNLGFGIPPSRRSTNATFILWTMSQNVSILLFTWMAFHLASTTRIISPRNTNGINSIATTTTFSAHTIPPIFAAVNRHGLIVFILANLMTGAVNLSMNTLEATNDEAILVIFCYLCSIGVVALLINWIASQKKKRE
mmetsp:Transcript_15452/g.17969  ORF Transcript_15452/g.17969 Transcript_15452/m.17969 type:complete len:558 (+) Transcript_15452:112-1785(+)